MNGGELSLVEQFRAIAGASRDQNRFSIARPAGHSVSVVFSPGSSESLELAVKFPSHEAGLPKSERRRAIALPLSAPRPLYIKLSREGASHVRAKEMGINREVQLGDPAFDGQVYINSPSGDEIIREVLSDEGARSAVRQLLDRDASVIVLDDEAGRVVVFVIEFRQRSPDQSRAERILAQMDKLAQSLPAVSAAPGGPLRDWLAISLIMSGILAFVGMLAAPLLYFYLTPERCRVTRGDGMHLACSVGPECCRPGFMGLLGGAALAVPLSIFFFFAIRGQSNSLSKMISAIVITSVLLLELGAILGRLVYG
ncbi:MAG: hypothetical protein HUU21_02565 [Polyangiaceae bacterium]|nr:hypothetical protein [Polyangiaceae bacterium]